MGKGSKVSVFCAEVGRLRIEQEENEVFSTCLEDLHSPSMNSQLIPRLILPRVRRSDQVSPRFTNLKPFSFFWKSLAKRARSPTPEPSSSSSSDSDSSSSSVEEKKVVESKIQVRLLFSQLETKFRSLVISSRRRKSHPPALRLRWVSFGLHFSFSCFPFLSTLWPLPCCCSPLPRVLRVPRALRYHRSCLFHLARLSLTLFFFLLVFRLVVVVVWLVFGLVGWGEETQAEPGRPRRWQKGQNWGSRSRRGKQQNHGKIVPFHYSFY